MKRLNLVGLLLLCGALTVAVSCGPSTTATRETPAPEPVAEEPEPEPVEEEYTVREVVVPEEPEFIEGVSEDAQKAFREGVILVYAVPPKYEEAADYFVEAIKLDKGFPEAYFNLGMIYQRMGRATDAIRVYQQALQAMPDNLDVPAYIGRVHLANAKQAFQDAKQVEGDRLMQQARDQFEAVIAKEPDNVAANNGMALYWLMKGDLDRAEEFVKQVLTVDPINTVALNTRGLVNYRKGNFHIAKWIYEQKVLRIDDKGEDAERLRLSEASSEAWNNLGLTYVELGLLAEAVLSLQHAVEVKPDNIEARMNLGAIYLGFLDYERALKQYEIVLQFRPADLEAIMGYGSSLYGTGEYEAAIERYRHVYTVDPERKDLLLRIGTMYETKLADVPKAIEIYEEYIAAKGLPEDDPLVGKVKVLKMMQEGGMGMPGGEMPMDDGEMPMDEGDAPADEPAATPEPVEEPAAAPEPAPAEEAAPAEAPAEEPAAAPEPAPAEEAAPAEAPAEEPAAAGDGQAE